jgi:hypothetical protein
MAEEHPTKRPHLLAGAIRGEARPLQGLHPWEQIRTDGAGALVGAIIGTFRPKHDKPEEAING